MHRGISRKLGQLIRSLRSGRRGRRNTGQGARRGTGPAHLTVEPLETRRLLAVIPVGTTADVIGDPLTSLRDAVIQANDTLTNPGPDTIQVPAGTYSLTLFGPGEDGALSGDLDVTDPTGTTTIQGSGAGSTIIDASLLGDRAFHVLLGAGLTLDGVTVTGGTADLNFEAGGGIYNEGGTLTVSNSTISNNRGTDGGGIYALGATTTILNSTVTGNVASNPFFISSGGGIADLSGGFTIDNSVISLNVAQGAPGSDALGGGIYSAGSTASVVNSLVVENQALGGAGDPFGNPFGGRGLGGGIGSEGTTWTTFSNNTISNNLAQGGDGADDLLEFGLAGDGGQACGGGIYSLVGTVFNFDTSTVADNQAIGGNGGSATLLPGSFAGNGGSAEGGGICGTGDTWFMVGESTISGNQALAGTGGDADAAGLQGNGGTARGGGVFADVSTWDDVDGVVSSGVDNVTVSGNLVQGGNGSLLGGFGGDGLGGGLHVTASFVTLLHDTIAFNSAVGGTAAFFGGVGGGIYELAATVNINSTIVAQNTASSFDPDVSGLYVSSGYNLIGDAGAAAGFVALGDQVGNAGAPIDPLLGPLQDNGGPTLTHALLAGSPAIDTADPASPLTNDQRFAPRPVNGQSDIGAYEATPSVIQIEKDTNGFDADTAALAPDILVNTTAVFTYAVTNQGVAPLSNITVSDSEGLIPVFQSGDTDGDNQLDVGETWIYTATTLVTAGPYDNLGTATGDDNTGSFGPVPTTVNDTDPSNHFGADPQIVIEKRTLDGLTTAATVATDFASATDGADILVNEDVTWIYQVTLGTGLGSVDLSNVGVTDNQGVTVSLLAGDDGNNILESGEVWYFTATGTAAAVAYTNEGTASGSFTDSLDQTRTATATDTSSYNGADPQIAIDKRTFDGLTTAATVAADFAVAGDGISIPVGNDVTWIYQVTSVGNVDLSNVSVIDNQGVTVSLLTGDNGNNILESTEVWYYTAVGTAMVGTYTNIGTASGSFTDTAGHIGTDTESDESSYTGEDQMGGEGCTPGFWKTHSIYGPAPLAGWPDTDYHPDDFVNDIFGTTFPDNPTLLEALSTGGGGVDALMRHAVAGLLNASNPNISYYYTESQVIQMTLDALAPGGDVEGTKDLFEYQNEMGCDLSPGGGDPPPPEPTDTTVMGMVWVDTNSNGQVDMGEPAIEGVTVSLTGQDSMGNAVMRTQVTDGDGVYLFDNLPASDASGYVITEVQPAGYDNDREYAGTVNGVQQADDADVFDDEFTIALALDDIAENFNFAEQVADQNGVYVEAGMTATIGFWQNKNGQNLIKSLNGGAGDTQLGNWLATTFPAMYGTTSQDPVNGLANKSNTQVADFFSEIFKTKKSKNSNTGPAKLDPQVMAVALAVYVTDRGLAGGNVAEAYGFTTFDPTAGEDPGLAGLGGQLFDIDAAVGAGTAETLFGIGTPSSLTVLEILTKTDENSSDGVIFEDPDDGDSTIDIWEAALRSLANDLFTAINEGGDI